VGLALGTRLNEMSTFGWGDVLPPLVIRVDLNGEQVGLEHSRVITVQADVDDVVTYATDQLHANPPHRSEPEDSHDQQAARGGVERDYLDVIGANLRAGDFIVCDMTKLGFWAIQALHLPKYARFLFPGLLTMGWGLPAAIGAAAGSPTSHVVLIVGDGGLLSILSELDLCKTLHGRLSIVLVDDDGYYMLQSQISEDLQGPTCEFPGPSWPDIAKAFSIPFFDVGTDPEVLSDVLSADHTGSRIVRIDGRTISRGFRYA
jgi:thiamine pyrophosphate-dependent acetolactate synthase large subunit-like protein